MYIYIIYIYKNYLYKNMDILQYCKDEFMYVYRISRYGYGDSHQ